MKETLDEILAEESNSNPSTDSINQEQEQIMDHTNVNATSTATAATSTEETESNQNNDASEQLVPPLTQTPLVKMDQLMVTRILQAFGTSVAHSQQKRYSQQQQQQHRGTTATSTATVEPPAALLKGRLQHYNRRNSKWRILLRDADFQRRKPLEKNRRKRERSSLWREREQDGGESTSTRTPTTKNSTTLNCTLEILAYNDLE